MVPSQLLKATPMPCGQPLPSCTVRWPESRDQSIVLKGLSTLCRQRSDRSQRQLIEGQHQLNQRIDRVIVVSVTAGATLTAAMIGGLVAIAILG